MSDIEETSRTQAQFLRAVRHGQTDGSHWPSASIFRRWMRQPRFQAAIQSLYEALLAQADLHLASLTTQVLRSLDLQLTSGAKFNRRKLLAVVPLMQMTHARQKDARKARIELSKLPQPLTFESLGHTKEKGEALLRVVLARGDEETEAAMAALKIVEAKEDAEAREAASAREKERIRNGSGFSR